MKTLIIYDEKGKLYHISAGESVTLPEFVKAAIIDIPEGKEIDRIDGDSGAVSYKDIAKTDTEMMQAQISAIYNKMAEGYTGTADNPIPWVYGMECKEGVCYSYNGNVYRIATGGYMNPCVWYPDSGIWQFEKI